MEELDKSPEAVSTLVEAALVLAHVAVKSASAAPRSVHAATLRTNLLAIRGFLASESAPAVTEIASSASYRQDLREVVRLLEAHLTDDARISTPSYPLAAAANTTGTLLDELVDVRNRHIPLTSEIKVPESPQLDQHQETNESIGMLPAIADKFGEDADRQGRRMLALYMGSSALLIAAITIGLLEFVYPAGNQKPSSASLLSRSLIPFIVAGFAIFLAYQASTLRRNSDEARRLQRQLQALPAYLAPLPLNAQMLLRGAMIQRLFPRLLEDNDPLREEDWFPDPGQLISAIDPKLIEVVAKMRQRFVDNEEIDDSGESEE